MRKNILTLILAVVMAVGIFPFQNSAIGAATPSLTIPVRPTNFPLARPEIGNIMISAGGMQTVGLREDCTAVYAGTSGWNQFSIISSWSNVVEVAAGLSHTVGLKTDDTVVAVGPSDGDGRVDVSSWTDIVAVSAGYVHTVGLKADGTVVADGYNDDGRCDVSSWTDIVAVSAGSWHTLGLKSDGTVVAVGGNYDGQCDVSSWTDIVAISAGHMHTVGLKAAGTVVAVGKVDDDRCDVSSWTDIVTISAGLAHTAGLSVDGTVVTVGRNEEGQCDVSSWNDIVAVSAGHYHTAGLKADGTVVAVGENEYNQCNVQDWQLSVDSLAPQADEIKVILNGDYIEFDQSPVIISGRTLVPLRAVFEALGADVYWIEDYEMVGIIKNEIKIFAMIGQKEIIKFTGGTIEEFEQELTLSNADQTKLKTIESDVAPQIINGRTLVPLRVISEALGIIVDWNKNTNTAILECDEEFINQKNEDKTFINDIISFFDKQFTMPYYYIEVETSQFVPEGIKELCRKISSMTDAVEIAKIITDKYGNPSKNYLDSPMFMMPVWEVEGGELSLVFFQGVTFTNEYGTWNLLPVYSKFSEVWRSELDISTEWGYYDGNSFISAVGAGDLSFYDDGLYEFQLNESIKDMSGVEDFIDNAFFSKYPTGKWEVKFERDFNWETDINTIKFNNLIATVHFTSDSGDTAALYIKKSADGFEFDISDELKCNISPYSIRPPFETDSMYPFI